MPASTAGLLPLSRNSSHSILRTPRLADSLPRSIFGSAALSPHGRLLNPSHVKQLNARIIGWLNLCCGSIWLQDPAVSPFLNFWLTYLRGRAMLWLQWPSSERPSTFSLKIRTRTVPKNRDSFTQRFERLPRRVPSLFVWPRCSTFKPATFCGPLHSHRLNHKTLPLLI